MSDELKVPNDEVVGENAQDQGSGHGAVGQVKVNPQVKKIAGWGCFTVVLFLCIMMCAGIFGGGPKYSKEIEKSVKWQLSFPGSKEVTDVRVLETLEEEDYVEARVIVKYRLLRPNEYYPAGTVIKEEWIRTFGLRKDGSLTRDSSGQLIHR